MQAVNIPFPFGDTPHGYLRRSGREKEREKEREKKNIVCKRE
jgi:hypothetical protein